MRRATCLVVDDDRPLGRVVGQVIEDLGHGACVATSLQEARLLLRRQTFDAGVFDLNVRGSSSFLLLEECEREGRVLPVILVSAALDERVREEAHRRGVRGCLAKPFALDELRRALGSALGARMWGPGDGNPITDGPLPRDLLEE